LIEQEKNMTRFVSTSIALFCSLALFASMALIGCGRPEGNTGNANGFTNTPTPVNTPTPPLIVNCGAITTTNDQIVKAIYDAIGASAYAEERKQFNITAIKPKVGIVGWSINKDQIVAIARGVATGCIIPDPDNFSDSKPTLGANYQQRIACPSGYGPCGDICIRVGEQCNVLNGPAPSPACYYVPASPTPTPTPTP
jgi:hypothetical protein